MKKITLELGQCVRWKDYLGGRWDRDHAKRTSTHVAARHADILVTDAEYAGWIAEAERWARADKRRQSPEGDVRRLIRVLDVEEAGPDPVAPTVVIGQGALASAIERLCTTLVAKVSAPDPSALAGAIEKLADSIVTRVESRSKKAS